MIYRLLLTFALVIGGLNSASAQNYGATAGSGLTFGSKLVSAVQYPQIVFCDPATPANCVGVNASGQITVLQGAAPWSDNLTQIAGAAPSATNPLWMATAQATVAAGNTLNAVVANTTGTSVAVTGYGAALVNVNCSVNCTGGTTVNFQASDVVGFQAVGAMPVAGGSAMVTSVVNQAGAAMFCIPNMGYTNMRANVTGYSAGTVTVTITPINVASCAVAQVPGAATAANQTNAAQKTQIVDGSANVIGSTNGAINNFAQAPTSTFGSLVKGTTAAMTATTSTQVIAAVASQHIYVMSIHCTNSSTSVPTLVQIQDGSGGTVLDTIACNSNFGGDERQAAMPLFWTTAGNGLFAADVTTGASVIVQASGYSSVN